MSNELSVNESQSLLMQQVVSLAKRRGFVFPGSEIYGGLANTWDYGPLGSQVMQNIRSLWWERFVNKRSDIYPVETGIIMNPKVWEASGHIQSFTDPLVECKICHQRFRADHLIPEANDHQHELAEPQQFNLMFKTYIGAVEEKASTAYLRPETAQGMFVNFKNVLQTQRPRLPFGMAQIGKVFRNEITPGNFIFRTLEFEQMEIEWFAHSEGWEEQFEAWKEEMWDWLISIGVDEKRLKWRAHEMDELSHYSKRTEDIEFEFPFGWGELYGLAYRTDYDLRSHAEKSGEDLRYEDPNTGERFFPHVIEPTFGINRTFLVLLLSAYTEEGERKVLKLNPKIAPYKAAVFPLVANKEDIVSKAQEVYIRLKDQFSVAWDDRGNIGKRYYSQDEIGTPWCITVDYQTLEDQTVTVRDRDTATQERIGVDKLVEWIQNKLTKA